jgi:hypothetical protein
VNIDENVLPTASASSSRFRFAAVRDRDRPRGRRTRARPGRNAIEGLWRHEHVARLLVGAEPEARDAASRKDSVDDERSPRAVGEDRHSLADADLERPCEVVRDRRVPRRRGQPGHAGRMRVAAEAACRTEVDADHLRARDGEDVPPGRGRGRVERREREDPVDRAPRDRLQHLEQLVLVGRPAGGDQFVHRPEVRAAHLPDRRVDRVADDGRAGDDRRAEQRAEHDQRRLARAADRIADREPPQDRTACEDDEEGQ